MWRKCPIYPTTQLRSCQGNKYIVNLICGWWTNAQCKIHTINVKHSDVNNAKFYHSVIDTPNSKSSFGFAVNKEACFSLETIAAIPSYYDAQSHAIDVHQMWEYLETSSSPNKLTTVSTNLVMSTPQKSRTRSTWLLDIQASAIATLHEERCVWSLCQWRWPIQASE